MHIRLFGVRRISPSARALAAETAIPKLAKGALSTTGEAIIPKQDATRYNNFYEFGGSKDQPAILAQKGKTSPSTVSIEGEVEKPIKLSMDDTPWILSANGASGHDWPWTCSLRPA
jgi:DMSO/TMAO reductase YedYZ molybdopterin-dependent catalytic subunit